MKRVWWLLSVVVLALALGLVGRAGATCTYEVVAYSYTMAGHENSVTNRDDHLPVSVQYQGGGLTMYASWTADGHHVGEIYSGQSLASSYFRYTLNFEFDRLLKSADDDTALVLRLDPGPDLDFKYVDIYGKVVLANNSSLQMPMARFTAADISGGRATSRWNLPASLFGYADYAGLSLMFIYRGPATWTTTMERVNVIPDYTFGALVDADGTLYEIHNCELNPLGGGGPQAPIPEPATVMLVGLGLVGAGVFCGGRRRGRKKR